jgi:hypothetical protein
MEEDTHETMMLDDMLADAVAAENERCLNLIRIVLDRGEYERSLAVSLIRIIKQ